MDKPLRMSQASKPLVSVVLPTYNRGPDLTRTLAALLEQRTNQEFSFEVIVVNNASSDNTAEVLAQFGDDVEVLLEERPGESFARNSGIKRARGEWLALLDDDERPEPDWLLGLLREAKSRDSLIVAGSVLADVSLQLRSELGPFGLQLLGEQHSPIPRQYTGRMLPATGNVLIHRRVFDTIGLFSQELTIASDTEFFVRARSAGFTMWITPRSVVHHAVPERRLQRDFFLVRAEWQGAYFVLLESKARSSTALYLAATRGLRALLLHLPLGLWWRLKGVRWRAFEHRLRLQRAWGCVRGAFYVLNPGMSSRTDYFAGFRNYARER